jgi:hypothetical protein
MASPLGCLELVHQGPTRQRYRLRSATPLSWTLLREQLQHHLGGLPLRWRLNRNAASVVLWYQAPDDGHRDGRQTATATLRQGVQALLAALGGCGAEPPEPAPIQIQTQGQRSALLAPLHWLLNGLSGGVSLMLLAAASALLLLGLAGMMLPLSPGGIVLALAYSLVELALWLRRPFMDGAFTMG